MTDDVLFPGMLNVNHRSSFFVSLDLGANMDIASLKIGREVGPVQLYRNTLLIAIDSRVKKILWMPLSISFTEKQNVCVYALGKTFKTLYQKNNK